MTNYTTIKSNSNNFNSKPVYKKHAAPVLPEGTFRFEYKFKADQSNVVFPSGTFRTMRQFNSFRYTQAITHAGRFHLDDVMGTALVIDLNPNIQITRLDQLDSSRYMDPSLLVYDIGLGEFDHHQDDKTINEDGIPYSAFGLLWESFGRLYLKKHGFTHIEEAFQSLRNNEVACVNIGDNCGYQNVPKFNECREIIAFNPMWYELKSNPNAFNDQFIKAVEHGQRILENWTRDLYYRIEVAFTEKEMWDKAINNSRDRILVLNQDIKWQKYMQEWNDILFVVTPSERGGYKLISVKDKENPIPNFPELSFVHTSGFMAIADTKDAAIRAAKKLVKNIENKYNYERRKL